MGGWGGFRCAIGGVRSSKEQVSLVGCVVQASQGPGQGIGGGGSFGAGEASGVLLGEEGSA
jgi:hypothetical protein